MRWFLLITLFGCAEPAPGDSSSSSLEETGNTDTAQPAEWTLLDGDCSPPEVSHTDPIAQLGGVFLQDKWFAELADIAVDPDQGMVYATGHMGLFAADISEPASPEVVDMLEPTWFGSRFYQVELGFDQKVFATNRDGGLSMIDRSDPTDLRELDRVLELGMAGMAASEELLVVADRNGGMWTYEIGTESLIERAHLDGIGHAWDVVVQGDLAYVGTNDQGLFVVDISDPDSPIATTTVAASGGIQDLVLSPDGRILYAAVGGSGIELFSLDEPTLPESLGSMATGYSAVSVAHGDGLLWASTLQDIVAFDLTDPQAPVRINTEETEQWAMAIAANADLAYVADWAWLSSFQRGSLDPSPDLAISTTQLFIDQAGEQSRVQLTNLGDAPVTLGTASSTDDRLSIWAETTEIQVDQSIDLRIDYSGGGDLNATICLSSSDPDEPQVQIQVVDGPAGDQLSLGAEAPDFELEDTEGNLLRLSDQRGRPVVLVYFATW
jgi:hypothetical protein